MKISINLFSVVLFFIVIAACENILTEEPKDFVSPSNFFKDGDDAELAIAGAYEASYLDDSFLNMNRHHAEYTICRGSFTSVCNFDAVINIDQFSRIANAWSVLYTTINRANVVMERIPKIENNIDPDAKNRIIAEAHFLRGWKYWKLLKLWGPVPLRLEEFTGSSPVEAPRASRADVYNQIISDLQAAETNLPDDVGSQTGKASKWAAKLMLAQVYLDMENWSAAAGKADEVIQSGNFSLIPVNDSNDFYNIFATTTNSEYIFAWQASINRSYNHLNWYHGNNNQFNKGTVWGFTMLVDHDVPLIQNWDDNDLRKDFNIYDRHLNFDNEVEMNDPQTQWRFGKFIKDDNGNATYSVPILRYAEAFLIYAEAANMAEGGPSALAIERLNTIRRRGYGLDPHSPSNIDIQPGMSQSEFRDRVIEERAYELFFEDDLRFWDLKRTDKIFDVYEGAGHDFSPSRLLYPIPSQELDNNPGISTSDQNPGY